jgi:protease-4
MKNFLTSLLGALVALFLFSVCAVLLFVGVLGAIISIGMKHSKPDDVRIEQGSYLVFDLSVNITDAPAPYDFSEFSNGRETTLQLRNVTRAIRQAATDERITGILLTGSFNPAGVGTGFGALEEVRQALVQFKRSGKPVKAYIEFGSTRDYYVESVANEITLDPYGVIHMPGLGGDSPFYAGAFEKYGIGIQVTRVGKYKSYVEPFTRKDYSPEAREETQRLLDDVWGSIVSDIARARQIKPAQVQAAAESDVLVPADSAKQRHLVDKIAYRDEVISELRKETAAKLDAESFKQVSMAAYVKQSRDPAVRTTGEGVAVVYAEGDIVDGEGDADNVGGVRFARELRKLRQDDDVKAIVLRVDSPGGSVTASENIQREIRLMRKVKPVIVSMGSYAASGGYWISAYGNRIFAEPTTITGSIGVFGIMFDVQKLAGDVGITFDGVKTGKFADAFTISRPKTPEEVASIQHSVDWVYGQFVSKVAEGRKLKPDFVEGIAQGRVWSGTEAKKLGLVDDIGGLAAAISYAAKQADLAPGFRIVEFPKKKDLAEAITELIGKGVPEATAAISHPGVVGQIERRIEAELHQLDIFNDPQGVYALLPMHLAVD